MSEGGLVDALLELHRQQAMEAEEKEAWQAQEAREAGPRENRSPHELRMRWLDLLDRCLRSANTDGALADCHVFSGLRLGGGALCGPLTLTAALRRSCAIAIGHAAIVLLDAELRTTATLPWSKVTHWRHSHSRLDLFTDTEARPLRCHSARAPQIAVALQGMWMCAAAAGARGSAPASGTDEPTPEADAESRRFLPLGVQALGAPDAVDVEEDSPVLRV